MTEEQIAAAAAAKAAENTVLLIELDEAQTAAGKYLGLEVSDLNLIAEKSFASAMRGKIDSVMTKAIKDKYTAESKDKKAVAAELETEIQLLLKMKRSLA